jgi:FkbM family methyltransferase
VFAIEPQSDVFETLRQNIRYNGLTNVVAENLALSDRNGTLELHRFSGLDFGHASMAKLNHRVAEVLSCPAVTLDEYFAQKSIAHITLIKLDVEGAELQILKGASELLRSPSPPMWVIEVNMETATASGYHPRDIFLFLAEFGYQAYRPVWGAVTRNVHRVQFCPPDEIEHGQNLLCAIPKLHGVHLSRVGVDQPDEVSRLSGPTL